MTRIADLCRGSLMLAPGEKVIASFFRDDTHGWVLLCTKSQFGSAAPSIAVASTQDGVEWKTNILSEAELPSLNVISGDGTLYFSNDSRGWLLLATKTGSGASPSGTILLTTSDAGTTWSELPSPPAIGRLAFATELDGLLVGGTQLDRIWTTHDGGMNWHEDFVNIEPPCSHCQVVYDGVPNLSRKGIWSITITIVSTTNVYNAFATSSDGGESWKVIGRTKRDIEPEAEASCTATGTQAIPNDYPFPSSDPHDFDPYGFNTRDSTSFAAWRMNRDHESIDPNHPWFTSTMNGGRWENAGDWSADAKNLGYSVDQTPAVGAIAQWRADECKGCKLGHVGYVEKVNTDGSVVVSEYNYCYSRAFDYRTIQATQPLRFIHINSSASTEITRESTLLSASTSKVLASPEITAQSGTRVMASPWLSASNTGGANVRDQALDSNLLFLQVGGVHGTVEGSEYGTAGGYTGTWWEIKWDSEPLDLNNELGWSADSVMALAPTAGDVPQPTFSNSYYSSNANIFWASGDAPTKSPNSLDGALGNCTWYAFGRMLELGANQTTLSALHGNASDWATEASANGISVDNNPTVHSIAQSVTQDHVAVVESYNSDGTITVTESSYCGPDDSCTQASSTWNFEWRHRTVAPGWFANFIHVPLSGSVKSTPTVTVTANPSSITTAQSTVVTVTVSPTSGNPTPTGSVTLTGGSFNSGSVALNSNGSASITVPGSSLPANSSVQLTATYSGDSHYNTNTGTGSVAVTSSAKATPTVTVTPSSSSITTAQSLTVTVAVSGSPTPTGTVTLTGGGYSNTQTLSSGSTTFSITAGSLSTGSDTLTATYQGDSNYNAAVATTSVTVAATQVSCSSYSSTRQITGLTQPLHLGLGSSKLIASGVGQAFIVDPVSSQVTTIPFTQYSGGYGGWVSILNQQAFIPINNLLQGEVAVLNLGNSTVTGYYPVGTEPYASLVVGSQLYIGDDIQWSNGNPSQVYDVNPASGQISASINAGHVINALASDPAHNRIYALNYNDSTASAIDLTSNTVTSTISLGVMPRAGIVFNGTLLVVGDLPNTQDGTIVEVDTGSNAVGSTISVGRDPTDIVGVNSCAFIPNLSDNTVSVLDLTANTIVKTISSGIGSLPSGAVADPSTGYVYVANTSSNSISILTPSSTTTPTVTVVPSPSSITTAQQLSVAVTVSGNPTPTGSVVLVAGTGSFNGNLVNGVATIPVPAGTFAAGTDQLTATYTPDSTSSSVYNSATGTGSVIVTAPAKTTPTVTVTPSASSITTAQALTVTVVVSGGTGNPTPSGTVTLSSGSYSAQQTLASGTAGFTIAAGTLGNGANTLTASYSGDATYAVASSTTNVTVEPVSVTTTTPSAVNPGSSTTSTVTLTGSNGYSGTMTLTCTPASSPANAQSLPTCSLNPTSVTLASGGNGTSTLTVKTTAASTTALARPTDQHFWKLGSGGAALAALLLFGIPFRRRRWASMLVLLLFVAAAGVIGCGGGTTFSGGGGGSSTPATTAGNYSFTVAATDSVNAKITASTTIVVTVQ